MGGVGKNADFLEYLVKPIGFLLVAVLTAGATHAQVATISNPPTPRQAGMGFAGAGMTGGVASAWFNPAGIISGSAESAQGFVSYQRPYNLPFFLDLAGGVAVTTKRLGAVAITGQSLSVSYQDEDLSAERTLGLAHAFYLLNDIHSALAVGYGVRLLYWDLGRSVEDVELGSDFALGVDVGATATLWERTRAGGSLRNLNAPVMGAAQSHQLPRSVQLGVSYEPYRGLLIALGADKMLGGEMRLQGGMELQAASALRLRAGAFSEPNSFTLGFGLKLGAIGFDYAFVSHPTLQGSHLIGLQFN